MNRSRIIGVMKGGPKLPASDISAARGTESTPGAASINRESIRRTIGSESSLYHIGALRGCSHLERTDAFINVID